MTQQLYEHKQCPSYDQGMPQSLNTASHSKATSSLHDDCYNAFNVYRRELAPGTVSLTGDRAQGDDSKHWANSKLLKVTSNHNTDQHKIHISNGNNNKNKQQQNPHRRTSSQCHQKVLLNCWPNLHPKFCCC